MSGQKNNINENLSEQQKTELQNFKPELDDVYNIIEKIMLDMKQVDSLWKSDPKAFQIMIKDKYPSLNEHYPAIFRVIFNPNFNINSMGRLKYMINMARRVHTKDIAEHDASVAVGQRLVDDIVKPQLDENKNKKES